MQVVNNYLEMMKFRISMLVMLTGYLGFYLGLRSEGLLSINYYDKLVYLLIGMFLSSSGCAVLNQYLEKDFDAQMKRTKNRPIPSNRVLPLNALLFGSILCVFGVFFVYQTINSLTAFICLLTILLYLFIYTPSKRFSTFNTLIGSIPGALPVLGGWTAATNQINSISWILFSILFCWQIPHFLAIAIIYAQDYKDGGFKMLPSEYPNSKHTQYHVLFFSIAMIGTSLGLYFVKAVDFGYFLGISIISVFFLIIVIQFLKDTSNKNAKKLMLATLFYFPLMFILIILDVLNLI
ncbi:MAG: protoheme IX farnesyltransferase [Candidatus Pelagibacter sp. TMED273]|nr:MAG: protoheme IX farnesyltransferase [Candidatus Pelagibacter sp. TMED273]